MEDINVGGGVNFGEFFEFFGIFFVVEEFDFFFFSFIGGEFGEGFEEVFGRFVENVDVLEERLVDGMSFEDSWVFV